MAVPDRERVTLPGPVAVSSLLTWPHGIARLGVVLCVGVALGFGLVYSVEAVDRLGDDARENAALNYDDREFAGGTALVSGVPLYEARALFPENETYRYVVGSLVEGASEVIATQVGDYVRYFLMPRRQATDARWIFCYGCVRGELGDAVEILYRDKDGIFLGRAPP